MQTPEQLAQAIANEFQKIDNVQAIAIAGSRMSASTAIDDLSDIDLYIYHNGAVSIDARTAIAQQFADQIEIDNPYWGAEDAWIERNSGIKIDLVYWHQHWIEEHIKRILSQHQAALGYTTCFWHTVQSSRCLFDRVSWFKDLQNKANVVYPEQLRHNIIALNMPVLREAMPAYINQIKAVVARQDLVSINHRLASFLASYFDVLFAVNRTLHPGEKRLVQSAMQLCDKIPPHMEVHIIAIVESASTANPIMVEHLNMLVDELEQLLID